LLYTVGEVGHWTTPNSNSASKRWRRNEDARPPKGKKMIQNGNIQIEKRSVPIAFTSKVEPRKDARITNLEREVLKNNWRQLRLHTWYFSRIPAEPRRSGGNKADNLHMMYRCESEDKCVQKLNLTPSYQALSDGTTFWRLILQLPLATSMLLSDALNLSTRL
jgi:hypothetical protein